MPLGKSSPHRYNDLNVSELDILKFYEQVLVPLTPAPTVAKILEVTMSGAETTDDIANVLAKDTELQHWVRLTVQRLGFEKHSSKLLQATILLGQNRIRDLILGRAIERAFIPQDETILGKMMAEKAKAASKEPAKKAEPKEGEAPPAPTEESEMIPALGDFKKYLEFASLAENTAISIRNSYPSQAFAGGVLFDYVKQCVKYKNFSTLKDSRLKNVEAFVEEVFSDGLRCGIAANEIMQKISIPHQKNIFVTALVHNIGKALLLIYDPPAFEKSFLMSTGADDKKLEKWASDEAESHIFELDHAQAGSLFLGRLTFLQEIERSIDFHHHPHLLKFSNPKLYALACVLRVSGALVKLYQRSRQDNPDTDQIRDQKLRVSEDFNFLKLSPDDWSEIKSNYALKLMKTGY
jgi:HD-like signal output (HDOD) protein